MHNIGTIEVLGRRFELKLDSRDQFCVNADGQEFSGGTRAGLIAVLKAHLKGKRKKIEMKCFQLVDGEVLPVMVTGVHAGNGNILYHGWDKDAGDWGPTQQTHYVENLFKVLTEPDNDRLERNLKIIADAEAVVLSLCEAIDKDELERKLGIK